VGRIPRLVFSLCGVVCFLAAAAVEAGGSPYQVDPYRVYNVYNADGSYAYTETVYTAYDPVTGQRKYVARPTPVSVTSVGALARRAAGLATPVGIGLTVLMAAYDVKIDRNPRPGVDADFTPDNYNPAYWRMGGNHPYTWGLGTCNFDDGAGGPMWYPSPYLLLADMKARGLLACAPTATCLSNEVVGTAWNNTGPNSAGSGRIYYYRLSSNHPTCSNNDPGVSFTNHTFARTTNPTTGTIFNPSSLEGPVGLTDYQVGRALTGSDPQPNSPTEEQLVPGTELGNLYDLLNEALRHGYFPLWSELMDTVISIQDRLNPEHEDYDSQLWPSMQHSEHLAVEGSQGTATGGGGSGGGNVSLEFPIFCEWASVVCNFIDWFTGEGTPPEPVDMPLVEVEEWDEVVVTDGNYVCPAPTTLGSFGGEPLVFSWALPCDFAMAVKPVVLVVSVITALLVLVGWRGA